MEEFIIPRCKLVEIPVTSTSGFLPMPNNLNDLNNSKICGVAAVDATELVTTPQNRTNFAAADLPGLVLVLKDGSDARIEQVPLYQTVRELNSGHYFLFEKFKWNSSSSGIQILNPGTLATTQSICLLLFYIPLDSSGHAKP